MFTIVCADVWALGILVGAIFKSIIASILTWTTINEIGPYNNNSKSKMNLNPYYFLTLVVERFSDLLYHFTFIARNAYSTFRDLALATSLTMSILFLTHILIDLFSILLVSANNVQGIEHDRSMCQISQSRKWKKVYYAALWRLVYIVWCR